MYDGNYLGTPTSTLSAFLHVPPTTYTPAKPLAGVKVGIVKDWFNDCTAEVQEASWAAVANMVALGATSQEIVRVFLL